MPRIKNVKIECHAHWWKAGIVAVIVIIAAAGLFRAGRYFAHYDCVVIHSSDMQWLEQRGQHEKNIQFDSRGCIRQIEFYDTVFR